MPVAQAQAVVPGLTVTTATPDADARALEELATWCLRYAPLTAPDRPDGVWIDATGCAHLFGGEGAMLTDVVERLAQSGVASRAAIADTAGAAWAAARFAKAAVTVVPAGETAAFDADALQAHRHRYIFAVVLEQLGLLGRADQPARQCPGGDASMLVELAQMRHRLLNDASTNANAAHQPPIAMVLAVLPASRVGQIHAPSEPWSEQENTQGRHYTAKTAPSQLQLLDQTRPMPGKIIEPRP